MAHFEIAVANHPPCDDKEAAIAGSYICHLHRWGARGIEHSFIPLGGQDPTDISVGSLAPLMLQIAEARAKSYRRKEEVPFGRLIGMSLLRLCVHPYTTPAGRRDVDLVGEYMESFGFVPTTEAIYPAQHKNQEAKVSLHGVSTKLQVTRHGSTSLLTAQHLMTTPALEHAYPVTHAAPSLAASLEGKNAWVALRAQPEETRFVETLVSHEELMDTFESVG